MRRTCTRRLVPGAAALLLAACANGYDDTSVTDGARDDSGGGDARDDGGAEDAPLPDSGDDAAPADDAAVDDAAVEDVAAEDAPPAEDAAEPDALWLCPPPGGLDCTTPGPGTGEGDECFDGVTCYMDEVQAAVRAVIDAHPEWFDSTGGVCDVVIVDAAIYRQGVVDALNARGDVCGYADTNSVEEVVVRTNITYSENFDILSSAMCARYGPAIYTSTCAPAWL